MPRKLDLTDHRYGKRTVICQAKGLWHCRCDCGVEEDFSTSNLRQGTAHLCSCTSRRKAGRGRLITVGAETLSLKQWAKRIGIDFRSLTRRFKRMSVEEAILLPVGPSTITVGDVSMTVGEWAAKLRVSNHTIRRWEEKGILSLAARSDGRGRKARLVTGTVTMTLRDWSKELGVTQATVLRWEKEGTLKLVPKEVSQEMLRWRRSA
jgi:DNA-binding transcriptional regulator YiaG